MWKTLANRKNGGNIFAETFAKSVHKYEIVIFKNGKMWQHHKYMRQFTGQALTEANTTNGLNNVHQQNESKREFCAI